MTNDELLALATRSEVHTDEERELILTTLKAVTVQEAYEVLLKINEASGESKEPLMRFLADDDELYNKVAAHVKEKFEAEHPESEDDDDDLEDEDDGIEVDLTSAEDLFDDEPESDEESDED